jgi:hypothetical protein
VICESLFEQTFIRESIAQTLIVRLGAAAVRFVPAPFLSILAAPPLELQESKSPEASPTASTLDSPFGLDGLVVQIGYSECTVLPVCHGAALVSAATTARLGTGTLQARLVALCRTGRLATWHFADGSPKDPSGLTSELDEVLLRGCMVEAAAAAAAADSPTTGPAASASSTSAQSQPASPDGAASAAGPGPGGDITLSVGRGHTVWLSAAARRAVCAPLLGGAGPGAGDEEVCAARLVLEALLRCPIDARARVAAAGIVLAGGAAAIPGLPEALLAQASIPSPLPPTACGPGPTQITARYDGTECDVHGYSASRPNCAARGRAGPARIACRAAASAYLRLSVRRSMPVRARVPIRTRTCPCICACVGDVHVHMRGTQICICICIYAVSVSDRYARRAYLGCPPRMHCG